MILDSNVFLTLPEETGIGAQTLTIFDESSLYYDFASKGTRCLHAIQDATAETLTYCQIRSMAAETKARRARPELKKPTLIITDALPTTGICKGKKSRKTSLQTPTALPQNKKILPKRTLIQHFAIFA